MRPAWRGAPAALRLPGWLTPSLLLLLLLRLLWCPHAARGDCGDPPDIPNATVETVNRTTFPVGFLLGYYCNKGFMKIFGKVNAVHCLENGEWSKPEVFCQRSCGSTPRLIYGHKQDIYIPVSYHPAGFIVVYECNPGYARNHSVSANVTCLQNYTWSKPEVFCYKRSCPDPGKIENGHISIPNGTLFASFIYFSCNPGYKLVGLNSTYCYYKGNDMVWDDPFPECQEIPTTTQKPTITDAQGTKAPSAPRQPTTVDVPATKSPSARQKQTTVNVPATQNQAVSTTHSTSKGNGLLTAGVTIIASESKKFLLLSGSLRPSSCINFQLSVSRNFLKVRRNGVLLTLLKSRAGRSTGGPFRPWLHKPSEKRCP
ncbi:complement decay-accelerating factor isoform X4 [Eptesicus fuscus]|uniref:complement decay-accelerating factor isoform X4 n=1 Tax=Eptesicus fuscus TaxID=29078 RepID=UPI002403E31C|nr:complement decay-accelerating factor isoform X4 [Eptesicus fuscus]